MYSYRHGHTRHIGLRGIIELMLIHNPGQYGVGLATRKGSGWRTRYVFFGNSGFCCVGW